MDKIYNHSLVEEKIYNTWESKGFFKPEVNREGKAYTIILPPPNANAPLHFGHAMYVVEDVLIRFKRMQGAASLWLPGADHAGFETQFVFEKKLAAEGKSRFDFDRETLYRMIFEHVEKNKVNMENQLRKLGFSLDWSRKKFTLDKDIIKIVYETFKKMFVEGLVYRDFRLVNYCTRDGTSFSDLEAMSEEKIGVLYYIKYQLLGGGAITVATTRPETLFADMAIMVNPKDERYKKLVGRVTLLPFSQRQVPVIADESVDMEFGTGAVKVTPGHDFNDFEVGKRHNLPLDTVIGFDGKLKNTNLVDGLYPKPARAEVVKKLYELGLIEKEEPHKMVVKVCYKCKTVLEPLPLEQWFVKVDSLKKPAIEAVKKGKIKIYPESFKSVYFDWLENLNDWNISRQVVWGIRIPAYRCQKNPESKMKNSELNGKWFVSLETPGECQICGECKPEQDKDTFDTWFSSAQWHFATLMAGKSGDFDKFYPTSVMETGYDILKAWVSRMVMMGLYVTSEIPFSHVVLHGLVNDPFGKKMSKSKGNVVNPIDLVDQYGADAVRFALLYGTALGHDQALAYPKLTAMRNFTNKLWNIGRFIELNSKFKIQNSKLSLVELEKLAQNKVDQALIGNIKDLAREITELLDKYDFNSAAQKLYDFIWHEFADKYIEDVKNRLDENSYAVLYLGFFNLLKILHPFMPFVTEELYLELGYGEKMLIIESWPILP